LAHSASYSTDIGSFPGLILPVPVHDHHI